LDIQTPDASLTFSMTGKNLKSSCSAPIKVSSRFSLQVLAFPAAPASIRCGLSTAPGFIKPGLRETLQTFNLWPFTFNSLKNHPNITFRLLPFAFRLKKVPLHP
jgi:hypothetical protein